LPEIIERAIIAVRLIGSKVLTFIWIPPGNKALTGKLVRHSLRL
jgi:hypothetical protein